MEADVLIVGAGPTGLSLASRLAKKCKVVMIEKKDKIGKDVKCAGLISKRAFKLSKASKKVVLNKIKAAVFKLGKFEVEIKGKMVVINREKFEKELEKLVRKRSGIIRLKTEFFGGSKNFAFSSESLFFFKVLVGADGTFSKVASFYDFKISNKLVRAFQFDVEANVDKHKVEIWFDKKFSKDFFAWVVPVSEEKARVGVMGTKVLASNLEKFLEFRFSKYKKSNFVADFIRYGISKETVKENILLIGEAASQTKTFSCGGIAYAIFCSKIAAECIKKYVSSLDEHELKNYELRWKKLLRGAMKRGYLFRKLMLIETLHKLPISLHFPKILDEDFY